MKITRMLLLPCLLVLAGTGTSYGQTFEPASAGDFGNSNPNYPPDNAIDGDTSFGSRWAATFDGGSANLFLDLGRARTIDDIGVAWGRGNRRSYDFEVRARSGTSGPWTRIFQGQSSGSSSDIEIYNVDDMSARQVRIKVSSNSDGTDYADVTEFEAYGPSGPSSGSNNNVPSTPTATRFDVPGRIEAEDFSDFSDSDSGNNGGAFRNTAVDIQRCTDSGCGFNIGWMEAGEWLDYPINVRSSGDYEAQIRVASRPSTGRLSFDIDGRQVSNEHSVSSTGGWQTWRTQTVSLGNLSRGNHTLRLNVERSSFNLNFINIVSADDSDPGSGGPVTPVRPRVTGDFGLDPNADPWDNFDLTRWALDSPAPRNDDRCRAERTWDYQWRERNPLDSSSAPFFFTHSDGGMRFVTRIDGQTTNNNCNQGFVRSELREMIRAGNRNIEDTGVTRNNWKLGYQPGNNSNWGGVNGEMNATLRVNRVTTTGDSGQVGRVIIGQIHARNDEPLRLYYRKRAGQSKGCIYFAHEIRTEDDINFEMIGDRTCGSGPSNGIELNELFSYTIINDDEDLTVIIRRGDRNGSVIAQRTIDMNSLNSGYDRSDESMYFKAGAYTQNSTGRGSDGDTVTFYRLSVSHD